MTGNSWDGKLCVSLSSCLCFVTFGKFLHLSEHASPALEVYSSVTGELALLHNHAESLREREVGICWKEDEQ